MELRTKHVLGYIGSLIGVIAMWFFAIAFAVAILASYANAASIVSNVSKDGTYASIYVDGDIKRGDGARLSKELEAATVPVRYVYLRSPGGSVEDGWEMAYAIRDAKANTVVSGKCASACTYAFMGGVKRWIDESDYEMGYHPAHISEFNGDLTLNDVYDMGQTHAIRTMTRYATFVASGEEWNTMLFIQTVYNTVSYKNMYWASIAELMNAGIVTDTY